MRAQHNLSAMVDKFDRRWRLSESDREALLAIPYRIVDMARGRFIAREGEPNHHCGVLLSGFAFSHKSTGDGARQILSIQMRGDLIDPVDCSSSAAAFSVQALTRVRVALLARAALMEVALDRPAVATALWMDTGANASILAEWLLNVGRRDARSRLSHLVCEMAVRQETLADGPVCSAELPMTQEQLGDATGLTSVHVNRTLQSLRRDGLIRTEAGRIHVMDWERLCEAGDFTPDYLQFAEAAEPLYAVH